MPSKASSTIGRRFKTVAGAVRNEVGGITGGVKSSIKYGTEFLEEASTPEDLRGPISQLRQGRETAKREGESGLVRPSNSDLPLSTIGAINQQPDYRQSDTNQDNSDNVNAQNDNSEISQTIDPDENPKAALEQAKQKARFLERQKEKLRNSKLGQGIANIKKKAADAKTKAKNKLKLASFAAYKFSYEHLIDSYGLTWFYLAFHFIGKYIMGSQLFCHFVSITNPALATKEILEGKDKMNHGAMIAFVLIGAIIIALLTIIFLLLFLIGYILTDPIDAIKDLLDLLKSAIGDLLGVT
ncbi:MAG TPA: hypothetical protein PLD95_00760 [bacterium]|jgi:hypothetical protein|nr:hypothetical protein [bacterium]HOG37984.1 hypothetical protein [bacterium]HQI03043.1 hypothetical protein [bacterium]